MKPRFKTDSSHSFRKNTGINSSKMLLSMKTLVVIFLFILYLPVSVNAQETDTTNMQNKSLEELMQIEVVTASRTGQQITDVPGVVTVLTGQELKDLGIRTVREALTLVPGFSPLQNDDEQILTMRGIYGSTNQKILVMRDGHSLNEANLDIPQTEYSLSIENIKQIEIIRGPGASLYGNSAVAAVMNIITIDSEGSLFKVALGSYGQYNMEMYHSTKTKNDGNLLIFGRYAHVDGQSYDVTYSPDKINNYEGTYKTYNYPRNYDFGINYKSKLISTSLAVRRHSYKTYWSTNGVFTNVDSLPFKLRLTCNSVHADVTLTPSITDKIGLQLQHFADFTTLINYRLTSPIDSKKYLHGRVLGNEWNVFRGGINYYGVYSYSEKGQALFGVNYENRQYMDSWACDNAADSSRIVYNPKGFNPVGHENRGAVFAQFQHSFTSWFRIDLEGRFDMAEKFESTFNPRVAIILNPIEKLTFKAVFTKAFMAPGYSYRTSNSAVSGSLEQLQPEKLTTYQASIRYDAPRASFIEVTAYYNKFKDLIFRNTSGYYVNFNKMASYGIETEARFNTQWFSIFANTSSCMPDTNNMVTTYITGNIYKKDKAFKYFPKFSSNVGVIAHPINQLDISLYAQQSGKFYGRDNIEVKSRIIYNATINVKNIVKNIELSFSVYNLFDKQYKLGDVSVVPIPQPGRWILVSVSYKL